MGHKGQNSQNTGHFLSIAVTPVHYHVIRYP